MSRVVVDISPATVTMPFASVNKSVSSSCPIVPATTIASVVTVPSKKASLNSTELEPKSISLSVEGMIPPLVKVTWLSPPAAIVITSEPENVIDVFVSASPKIESNPRLPTFDILASLKSNAPPTVSVPDMSTLPFISTVVAAICISVSATKSNCPSVDELIYIAVSRNCNFSVEATNMSSLNC